MSQDVNLKIIYPDANNTSYAAFYNYHPDIDDGSGGAVVSICSVRTRRTARPQNFLGMAKDLCTSES